VEKALLISGSQLLGHTVIVQASQAEKNRAYQATAKSSAPTQASQGPMKLHVGGLHWTVSEPELRDMFEKYGELDFVQLPMDQEMGRIRGYGFVQFKKADDARKALKAGSEMELHGRPIKVSISGENKGIDKMGAATGQLGELDDEGGGLLLSKQSRALLMQRLTRGSEDIKVPGVPTPAPPLPAPALLPVAPPSQYLLLRNMFDPTKETDPNFHLEVQEEVGEECRRKFGPVLHVFVDKDSAGHVYLKFGTLEGAQKAQIGLNKRWFSQNQISAEYMDPQAYHARFPDAPK